MSNLTNFKREIKITQAKSTKFPIPKETGLNLGFITNLSPSNKFTRIGIDKTKKKTKNKPTSKPCFRVTKKIERVVNSIPPKGSKFILPKIIFSKRTKKQAKNKIKE